MADDLGWGSVGFHNAVNSEVQTPHLDELVRNGLELNRHYVYSGCAPTRASFQSGRLPVHVTTNNGDGLEDPTHGIPTQMTGLASKLREGGYSTHLVGKWDCGFSTWDRLPRAKGYDSFFGYLGKSLGYFSKLGDNDCSETDFADLWQDDAPALTSLDQLDGEYVELLFAQRVQEVIQSQSQPDSEQQPFFLMYSMHLPHYPSEVPEEWLQRFADDENQCQYGNEYIFPTFTSLEHGDEFACRSVVQAQVSMLDAIVGGVVETLRMAGQWDNTLLIFASDNGGSLELNDTAGNNWPLRGGKSSFLEGGIRSTSFVSGGFLPEARRGQREQGLMHIADWYKTLCGPTFAAVDWRDATAAEANLPSVDGYDLWPLLSGAQSESPRRELVISSSVFFMGDYKLVVGKQEYAVWTESRWPTASTPTQYELKHTKLKCSARSPCLFNVARDPSERDDVADDMRQEVELMQNRFEELAKDFFYNQQQGEDSCPAFSITDTADEDYCGCWMAFHNYNYFAGPYQDLKPAQMAWTANSVASQSQSQSQSAIPIIITTHDVRAGSGYGRGLWLTLSLSLMVLAVLVALAAAAAACTAKAVGEDKNDKNDKKMHMSYGAQSYGTVDVL